MEYKLAQNRHAFAVLVGGFPSEVNVPHFNLNNLTLPTELPVTLPSSLVRQRPDVLAAEATLHSACALIGFAKANYFPQITLGANSGWTAVTPSALFQTLTAFWNYSAQMTQSIFNGGAQVSTVQANVEAFKQAAAQYEQTVLQAFQNVADALRAIEADARTLKAQEQAEKSAYGNYILTAKQYRLGGASYLSLLTAEQQYEQTRINLIQAEAARYSDTAALFQALGGGWWNRPPANTLAGVEM